MNQPNISWIDQLDRLIAQKHMLLHPFYQAWSQGMLTKTTLQTYAKKYYQHVKAFPTYLSTLHSLCDDLTVRHSLLSNLMDEEMGDPNHIQLWRAFALSLGVTAEEVDNYQPEASTQALVAHFRSSCHQPSLTVGLTVSGDSVK